MKRASTATGKKLIGKLINSKEDTFIVICYELLENFYSDLWINEDLSIIVYGNDINGYTVFYCFSTKNTTFEEKDFKNSKIDTIFKKLKKINHITIIYQKNLIDDNIRKINQEFIINIYKKYKVSSIEVYTPTSFIEYIFSKARDILYDSIDKANEKFRLEFQERLSQDKIYIEDVPFILNKNKQFNPKKYILTNYVTEQNSSAKSWIFVVSEFGFGKTSLLINLPNSNDSYKYIYIPFSQLSSNAFSNETELSKSILEIIFTKTLDTKNSTIDKIFVTEFRQLLRFQKDIVLLYDGLDEYHISYTQNGLKQIFTCSTSFVCNSIFTVRKEFIDERSGNFDFALNVKAKPKYSFMNLKEWDKKEILSYISNLKITKKNDKKSYENLTKFESIVKRGKYYEVYGDIPTRPLFLNMLCEDIASGNAQIKNISQLYESYLTKKFDIDRTGSVLSTEPTRPLSIDGDIITITDYIFELLAKIAWDMITIDGIQVRYNESIDEKSILKLIKNELSNIKIIELLLNSVLVPFDKRERRTFKAKFAHKSFQEYFLAYYLIYILLKENILNTTALMLKYSQGTIDFCKYMVKEVEGMQDKIDSLYVNSSIDINPDSLLYRLASIYAHEKRAEISQEIIFANSVNNEEYDFFISHSSKDKFPFVDDLVNELNSLGLKVFYDKNSIESSDNIVWKINEGFNKLKYGVILVLSPNFLQSDWCNEELAISFSLKVEKSKKLIPILLNISHDEIQEKYSILRTTKSIDSTNQHVKSLAQEIFNII